MLVYFSRRAAFPDNSSSFPCATQLCGAHFPPTHMPVSSQVHQPSFVEAPWFSTTFHQSSQLQLLERYCQVLWHVSSSWKRDIPYPPARASWELSFFPLKLLAMRMPSWCSPLYAVLRPVQDACELDYDPWQILAMPRAISLPANGKFICLYCLHNPLWLHILRNL